MIHVYYKYNQLHFNSFLILSLNFELITLLVEKNNSSGAILPTQRSVKNPPDINQKSINIITTV